MPAVRGFSGVWFVGAEAVEFTGVIEGGLVAPTFFGDDVEDDRVVLLFEELEGSDQGADIVAIDRAVVAESEFFEEDAGDDEVFRAFLDPAGEFAEPLPGDFFEEAGGAIVEVFVGRAGRNAVKVAGDGADVFVDRPFVVVEDDDEPLGGFADVVERLEAWARR